MHGKIKLRIRRFIFDSGIKFRVLQYQSCPRQLEKRKPDIQKEEKGMGKPMANTGVTINVRSRRVRKGRVIRQASKTGQTRSQDRTFQSAMLALKWAYMFHFLREPRCIFPGKLSRRSSDTLMSLLWALARIVILQKRPC